MVLGPALAFVYEKHSTIDSEDRWIEREGPRQSPILTSLEFFLPRRVVYEINHPSQRTLTSSATPKVLIRMWQDVDCRLDVCRVTIL